MYFYLLQVNKEWKTTLIELANIKWKYEWKTTFNWILKENILKTVKLIKDHVAIA